MGDGAAEVATHNAMPRAAVSFVEGQLVVWLMAEKEHR